jgi:hypothetical protein
MIARRFLSPILVLKPGFTLQISQYKTISYGLRMRMEKILKSIENVSRDGFGYLDRRGLCFNANLYSHVSELPLVSYLMPPLRV